MKKIDHAEIVALLTGEAVDAEHEAKASRHSRVFTDRYAQDWEHVAAIYREAIRRLECYKRWLDKASEGHQRKYRKRMAAGLCIWCGQPKKPGSKSMCADCLGKARERGKLARAKRVRI